MVVVTGSGKHFIIDVLADVSFVAINSECIGALYAYWQLCDEYGVRGVVTGAANNPAYLCEPLHRKGLAWDFRSYIFPDQAAAASRLAENLKRLDPAYRVVYIKPPKPVHFHVEYRGK